MPNSRGNNKFVRVSLLAGMNENPAVMQASGWYPDPKYGVIIGDPNEEGATLLRNSLKEIGKFGLSNLGGEAAVIGIQKLAPKVPNALRVAKGYRNFKKSRQNYHILENAYDGLMNQGQVHTARQIMYPGYKKGDIIHMDLFRQDFPDKETFAKALRLVKDHIHVPGKSTMLITDDMLSTDSAPLLLRNMARDVKAGRAVVEPIMDNGAKRMIMLNRAGNRQTLDYTNQTIKELRKASGIKIPDAITVKGVNYTPAIKYTFLKRYGGCIKK